MGGRMGPVCYRWLLVSCWSLLCTSGLCLAFLCGVECHVPVKAHAAANMGIRTRRAPVYTRSCLNTPSMRLSLSYSTFQPFLTFHLIPTLTLLNFPLIHSSTFFASPRNDLCTPPRSPRSAPPALRRTRPHTHVMLNHYGGDRVRLQFFISFMVVMYFVMGHMFIAVLNYSYLMVLEFRAEHKLDAASSVTLWNFLEIICPAVSRENRHNPDL